MISASLHKKNIVARFRDLNEQARRSGRFSYSEFHSLSDAIFLSEAGVKETDVATWGGYEGAEKVIFRFGNEVQIGYSEPYPIDIIQILPSSKKFGTLQHRDILGTIMGLGLERDTIGDIKLTDDAAYVMAQESISEYVLFSITQVRNLSVTCRRCETLPEGIQNDFHELRLIVPSERVDCFVSAITKKSRSQAQGMIAGKKVLLNGCPVSKNTTSIHPEDILVIRGYGKFIYEQFLKKTGSGNMHIVLRAYSHK